MCGINGILTANSTQGGSDLSELVAVMNSQIRHRGPDSEGIFVDGDVALGMRRLSIIDLEHGDQPIYSDDRSLVIVFNGEIYNYRALKDLLTSRGHSFRTESDTEVVLHCYQEWGPQSFEKLTGMFAFAIFDLRERKLLLGRDRTGEKPLYYSVCGDRFIFGSELKSLMVTGLPKREIDRTALRQYLQLTYIPAPLTIIADVFKLPAGYYLEVSAGEPPVLHQYWNMQHEEAATIRNYDECKRLLRSTLFEAVKDCLVADVPVGSFLSGGVDSTIITGIASQLTKEPLHTFTVGFHQRSFDESGRAARVAQLHGTTAHVTYLDYEDVLPELSRILANIDEPFADSSYIATYVVSKFARQFVKTALTGDGGDELFGGYSKYLIGYYSGLVNRTPSRISSLLLLPVVNALPRHLEFARQARKVLVNSSLPLADQRVNLMCLGFSSTELVELLIEGDAESDSLEPIKKYYSQYESSADEVWRTLYTDFKVVLEGDMLAKVDRSSMLASLETRVPMLHPAVVELAARIPSEYKISLRHTKVILRETFSDLIPPLNSRASKRGFGVPVSQWLRLELRDDLALELSQEFIVSQGIFHFDYVDRMRREHMAGTVDHGPRLWTLYVFQKWYRRELEGSR